MGSAPARPLQKVATIVMLSAPCAASTHTFLFTADCDLDADGAVVITADAVRRRGHLELPLADEVTYRFDQRDQPIDLDRVRFVHGGLSIDAAQLVGAAVARMARFELTARASPRPTAPWSFDLDHDARGSADASLEIAYHEAATSDGAIRVPVYFCKTWS